MITLITIAFTVDVKVGLLCSKYARTGKVSLEGLPKIKGTSNAPKLNAKHIRKAEKMDGASSGNVTRVIVCHVPAPRFSAICIYFLSRFFSTVNTVSATNGICLKRYTSITPILSLSYINRGKLLGSFITPRANINLDIMPVWKKIKNTIIITTKCGNTIGVLNSKYEKRGAGIILFITNAMNVPIITDREDAVIAI